MPKCKLDSRSLAERDPLRRPARRKRRVSNSTFEDPSTENPSTAKMRRQTCPSNKNRSTGCKKKTTQNIDTSWFYTIPNSKLLALLITISIIVAIVFLVAFKYLFPYNPEDGDSLNTTAGSYLALVALPVGVVLSFIVASAWSTFADAQAKENLEATELLLLYNAVRTLPGGEEVARAIEKYTQFVIDVEFPLMQKGIQSQEGTTMLFDIGDMIFALEPESSKEETIYSQVVNSYEDVATLRIARMGYTTDGIPSELWWVMILGVVIVIVVSFFVYSRSLLLQVVLTALAVAALVGMLFLILVLNFPYRGDFSLDSLPFEIALSQMFIRGGFGASNRTTRSSRSSRSSRTTRSSRSTTSK